MNVRRVAEHERAILAKTVGHAMVHAVGREPVHAPDVDPYPFDHALAHIVPRQVLVPTFGFIPHCADEPRTPVALQWEHREEIGSVQRDVQFAVQRRSACLDVGDVEQMFIRAARKADLQRLAHGGMGSVAPGNVRRLARFHFPIRPLQTGEHTIRSILEAQKLRWALDPHAGVGQAIDQQTFVFVLRKDQRVRKGAEAGAHFAEYGMCRLPAGHPQIGGEDLSPALDDWRREADLAVELERPRLHGKSARGRPGFRSFVDDPHAHSQPGQPERQHQTRRPCADDEDVGR